DGERPQRPVGEQQPEAALEPDRRFGRAIPFGSGLSHARAPFLHGRCTRSPRFEKELFQYPPPPAGESAIVPRSRGACKEDRVMPTCSMFYMVATMTG